MLDESRSINKLFSGVPLSEPLIVFKDTAETIIRLIEDKEESRNSLRYLGEMIEKAKMGDPAEIEKLPWKPEELEFASKFYLDKLQSYQDQQETLMPMSFVYLVATWDAFILDTARKILSVHPHSISESQDSIEINKSALWNFNNLDEVRDYVIESEVRKLDFKRMRIARSFKEYWGIDWEKSKVPLNKIVEIRARRDIWVHNGGRINQQYVTMVGASASKKLKQSAEITPQYLWISLTILVRLATFIHKVAHEKHYSKA